MLNFVKDLSCIYWNGHVIFTPGFIYVLH
jgi:hypothetical protein